MTMHYSAAEDAYIEGQRILREQMRNGVEPSFGTSAPAACVPDYDDAERIWKLLVDAAQN